MTLLQTTLGGSGGATVLEPITKNAGNVPSRLTGIVDNFFTGGGTNLWTGKNHVNPGDYPGTATVTLTINNNAVVSPNGLTTATSLVEGTNNGNHVIWNQDDRNWSFLKQAHPFRLAFFAKAGARTRIVASVNVVQDNGAFEKGASVGYDLAGVQTGYDVVAQAGSPDTTGTWTITNQSIISVGSGWCYCTLDCNTTIVPTASRSLRLELFFYIDNGSGTAARSISYTGDGASGLSVWWVNILPVLAFNSFNTVKFFDDFLTSNTIDLNGTLGSGFNWYLRTKWPSMAMTNFGNTNSADTSNSGMSVANSVFTWAAPGGLNNTTNWICTAYSNPFDTTKAKGTTFSLSLPTIFESNMCWGSPEPSSSFTWPIGFWGQTVEGMTNNPANTSFLEIDAGERDLNASVTLDTGITVWTPPTSNTATPICNQTPPATFPVFNTYSLLWIPHTAVGANSVGVAMYFFNGKPSAAVGLATMWASGSSIGNLDNQTFFINLSGGNVQTGAATTWPTYYDWVKVTN